MVMFCDLQIMTRTVYNSAFLFLILLNPSRNETPPRSLSTKYSKPRKPAASATLFFVRISSSLKLFTAFYFPTHVVRCYTCGRLSLDLNCCPLLLSMHIKHCTLNAHDDVSSACSGYLSFVMGWPSCLLWYHWTFIQSLSTVASEGNTHGSHMTHVVFSRWSTCIGAAVNLVTQSLIMNTL